MKRRTFLSAVASGVGGVFASAQTTESRVNEPAAGQAAAAARPTALFGPRAEGGYFSEERMLEALGTHELMQPNRIEVVVYNFPSWHASPWMEARFGKGWSEWDTLRDARTLFPGHTMPHYPLWGYYDEAEPAWAAREIDLAATYGVDAWMVDWYWHEGTQFYQEQLEKGFLQAANRAKLRFAVMWANHDWKNVYPARNPSEAAVMLKQVHTLEDFGRVAEYCADRYWKQPNAFRIGGAPVFSIFDGGKLLEQMGSADGVRRGLDRMRDTAAKAGVPALHLQVANGYDRYAGELRAWGFDSATQYGTFGWTYGAKPAGCRLPYGDGCVEAVASWAKTRGLVGSAMPFYPCAQVGWDDSPRFGEYAAIAIDRSPDQFERLVRAARHELAAQAGQRLLYVAAWNEWTEDHVLLPDSTWGYSYLESLRRAVQDQPQPKVARTN